MKVFCRMSLVVRCLRCEKDHEISEKNATGHFLECPHCNTSADSENFQAVMFCPHCYAELLVPLDVLKRELQCPYCDKVFRANLSFSLSESDDAEDFKEIETNAKDTMFVEGDVFDKYKIIRLLGKGGMGEVYLARHMLLQSDIALKIMNNDAMVKNPVYAKRFIREAKLANRIDSENFIAVYDVGKENRTGSLFIAMEYVDGCNVSEIMKEKGVFAEKDILQIALKVTEVLIILEREKIVHRDIKPSNIMVSANGTVKLADFGIAKSENSGENELTLTQGNLVFGTPNYASPEQCRSSHNVDYRSDIYSLGATMFHMAAGQPPYDGTTAMETVIKVLNEEHQDLSQLTEGYSSGFILLINDMLERDPDKRPPNAEALKMRIEHLLAGRMNFAEYMRVTGKIAGTQLRYAGSKTWEIICKIFSAIPHSAIKRIIKAVITLIFIGCGIFFGLKYRNKFVTGFNYVKSEITLNTSGKTDKKVYVPENDTLNDEENSSENDGEPKKERITRDNFELSDADKYISDQKKPKAKNSISSSLSNDRLYVALQERLKICNDNLNTLLKSENDHDNRIWLNERIKFFNSLQKNLQQQLEWRKEAYNLLKHSHFDKKYSSEIQRMVKDYSRSQKSYSFINNDQIFAQQLLYYLKNHDSDPNVIITDVSHPDFSGPLLRWLEHADIPLKKDIEKILFEHHVSSDCITGNCSVEVCQYGISDLSGILRQKILEKKYSDAIALVYCGADVNEKDQAGLTPLHWAIIHDNKPLVRTILLAGGDVNLTDENGQTPLFYTVRFSNSAMYNMLMTAGADSSVVDKNDKKAMDYVYMRKFYSALQNKNINVIEKLLEQDISLLNTPVRFDMTPLQYACNTLAMETVELLLHNNADVNKTTDSMPYTPLQIVYNLSEQQKNSDDVRLKLLKIFRMLLKENVNINLPPVGSSNTTLLQAACCELKKVDNIHLEYIKALLEKSNPEKDIVSVIEKLYEYNRLNYSGDDDTAKRSQVLAVLMTAKAAFENEAFESIMPAVAWSPKCSDADIDLLINKGISINSKDKSGRTALYKVCEYAVKRYMYLDDEAINRICSRVLYLLKKGANKDAELNGRKISDMKLPEKLKLTLNSVF